VLGRPHDNDGWNRSFSTRHGFLVVGLDYSKAPSHPFPTATHDLEALITSVLSDLSLPVDVGRVAVAGFSAGGNLALSVCQLPSLQGRLAAAVPVYPVVDFVTPQETKARARRYKPSLGGFRARDRDFLLAMSPMFNWSYVNPGTRRDDPLLSPQFAERGTLPRSIFMIACEMDLLGPEAWRMACKLAGKKVPGVDEVIGKEETAGKGELITEGDERFAWEEETEDGGRYKWLLVPDTIHGFDQDNIARLVKDPVTMEDARIKRDKVIGMIGDWLLGKAFKKES
jgi:acetyl esterase/lipase